MHNYDHMGHLGYNCFNKLIDPIERFKSKYPGARLIDIKLHSTLECYPPIHNYKYTFSVNGKRIQI